MEETNKKETKKGLGIKKKLNIIAPLSHAMRFALLSCIVLAAIFCIFGIIDIFLYYNFFTALLVSVGYILAIAIITVILTLLFVVIKKIQWQTILVITFSILLCIVATLLMSYLIPMMLFGMIFIYFLVMFIKKEYKEKKKFGKVVRFSLLIIFGLASTFLLFLTFWPGLTLKAEDRPKNAELTLPFAENINVNASSFFPEDPSLPGSFNYNVFYYASSNQKVNPYPNQNILSSKTVDASELLSGWSFLRESQLGYDTNELPLNAKVYLPEGEGPFPIALFVHGNHESGDRSDEGYSYLCELLASRGIISVAVDENYLNGSTVYNLFILSPLKAENGTRAYILLEHLKQLYSWNNEKNNQLYGKMDFSNVALVGHSRGGEAVALAAAFSELKYYPDNGFVSLDYPFRIKTVIAIAPVHEQYYPAGLEVSLKNTNYLVLHGGHDMDVLSFMGANMYSRVDVTEYGIKAKVWVQHANHGQFNSSWGSGDLPGVANLLSNRKMLMSVEEQEQVAKVLISAFLESTLKGKEEYNKLFSNFSYAKEWLPNDRYITSYSDSEYILLDDFDETYDLSASSSNLIKYSAEGLDSWTKTELLGKIGNSNRVLQLSWGSEEKTTKYGSSTPIFKFSFNDDVVTRGDKLYLSLCSDKTDSDEANTTFLVKLTDSNGNSSIMSIDDYGGVVDPIDVPIYKPILLEIVGKNEPVLQMICIDTERFEGLDGSIISMEWVMSAKETDISEHTLYVDDFLVLPAKQ